MDLQRRREERSRDHASNRSFRREGAHDPYLFSTLGLGLATPASWLSLFMLMAGSPLTVVAAPMIPSAVFVVLGIWQLRRERPPDTGPGPGAEKQLLMAIRDSGGGSTPVEAALETSLSVDEAEEILTRLVNRGHLLVESRDGTLSYTMPGRRQKSGHRISEM